MYNLDLHYLGTIIGNLSGVPIRLYDGEKLTLSAGQVHYCPKGHSHTIRNDGEADVVFFAVLPNSS